MYVHQQTALTRRAGSLPKKDCSVEHGKIELLI